MMKSFSNRLADLERLEGRTVVVKTSHDDDWRPLSADEAERRRAAARQQAGPHGTVIEVVYVEDWRPDAQLS